MKKTMHFLCFLQKMHQKNVFALSKNGEIDRVLFGCAVWRGIVFKTNKCYNVENPYYERKYKQMKKLAKLMTLVLALMLCISNACAGIMVTNVSVPELKVNLYIPPYLNILTRDVAANDPALATIGMDAATVKEYLTANALYVDAFPYDVSYELTVAGEPNDVSSFREYGSALIEEVCKQLPEIYAGIGMTVTSTETYSNDAADFIKLYYIDGTSGAKVVQYYTIVNNMAVNFRMFSYTGEVTADLESIIKMVVDNAVFVK